MKFFSVFSVFSVFLLAQCACADVTLINSFEVPTSQESAFISAWSDAKSALQKQPGCLGGTLYRSKKNPNTWMNVAIWSSKEKFLAALKDPLFKLAAKRISDLGAKGSPDLFDVVNVYQGLSLPR